MTDYSNTIIYKIFCKDPLITDIYVGHTINLPHRTSRHISRCNNPKSPKYNYFVYQIIRENGGWENWTIQEIEKIHCVNKTEAIKYERYYFDLLGATLNSNIPARTVAEWIIDNKQKHSNKCKEYYENHKQEHLNNCKKYYEENKDQIKEYKKQYSITHKSVIDE